MRMAAQSMQYERMYSFSSSLYFSVLSHSISNSILFSDYPISLFIFYMSRTRLLPAGYLTQFYRRPLYSRVHSFTPLTHSPNHALTNTLDRELVYSLCNTRTHAHTRTHIRTHARTHARAHTHTHTHTRTYSSPMSLSPGIHLSLFRSLSVSLLPL